MRHGGREVGQHHRHSAADNILERRRRAFVRHVQHADSGYVLDRLESDNPGRVARGKGQLPGIGLGIVDQLLHRVDR